MGPLHASWKSHLACLALKASLDTGILHWKALHTCPYPLIVGCQDRALLRGRPPTRDTLNLALNTVPLLDVSPWLQCCPSVFPHPALHPSPSPWRQEGSGEHSVLFPLGTQSTFSNTVSFGKDSLNSKQSTFQWTWNIVCLIWGLCVLTLRK